MESTIGVSGTRLWSTSVSGLGSHLSVVHKCEWPRLWSISVSGLGCGV